MHYDIYALRPYALRESVLYISSNYRVCMTLWDGYKRSRGMEGKDHYLNQVLRAWLTGATCQTPLCSPRCRARMGPNTRHKHLGSCLPFEIRREVKNALPGAKRWWSYIDVVYKGGTSHTSSTNSSAALLNGSECILFFRITGSYQQVPHEYVFHVEAMLVGKAEAPI